MSFHIFHTLGATAAGQRSTGGYPYIDRNSYNCYRCHFPEGRNFLRFFSKITAPYCSSKSEEGGKSGLVPENKGCHKKKTRPQFFFKTLFLLREVFKSNLETSLRRNKDLIKNCARVIFF